MDKLQKRYTPYEGNEHYIYFAFTGTDAKKAERILRVLYERGCRVWYCTGQSGSSEELQKRQERACSADLTVLYLTDSACADSDLKNNVLVNQSAGRSILCLDPDDDDRRLMMGLYESIPHIAVCKLKNNSEIENALIHSECFSQGLLGEPAAPGRSIAGKISLFLCVLAVILAIICLAGYRHFTRPAAESGDEILINDPVIRSALRDAANGSVITEDLLSQISFLKLDGMPESWEDLSLMPELERINIPQQSLLDGAALPEGNYTIELSGGAP